MAEKRMFSVSVIDSDLFLDMPLSAQALYFHLSMRADDDGFVNNPKKIIRMVNASEDDMRILLSKSFVISFESGVVVIKHWRIHNTIRKDMYKPTVYTKEKGLITEGESKEYLLCNEPVTDTLQLCNEPVTEPIQDRNIDKIRLDKNRLDKNREEKEEKKKKSASRFSPPSLDDVKNYCRERNNNVDAEHFIDYYESNGWKVGKNSMKDWKAAVRNWEKNGYSNSSNKGGDFVDQYGRINFSASHFDENDPTVF